MLRATSLIASALCLCLLAPVPVLAQGYGNTGRDSTEAPPSATSRPTLPNILTQGAKPPVRPETQRLAPAQRAECAWLGKRVILVLLRDDLIATKGFMEIYTNFGCPIQHIGRAFGCATPAANQAQASDVKVWVDDCWDNPDIKPLGMVEDPATSKDDPNKPKAPAAANSRPDGPPRR